MTTTFILNKDRPHKTPFQEHGFVLYEYSIISDYQSVRFEEELHHRCAQNVDPRQHFKRTTSCVLAPGSSLLPEPAAFDCKGFTLLTQENKETYTWVVLGL